MTSVIVPDLHAGWDAEVSHLPFHPDQLPAVLAMLGRCSRETLFTRFHGATDGTIHALDLARRYDHWTLGAWNGPDCVGLATLARGEESNDLGVLVEDTWQRRGIGTVLLRDLADLAGASDITELHAEVLAENRWVLKVLARIGVLDATARWGVYSVTVRVMSPARRTELGRQQVDHSCA
jgi:GNAT superfamily N-acetyltransferase